MEDTPQQGESRLLLPSRSGLALAVAFAAAVVLALAPSARSTPANIVPNPGFEQAGCGDGTPDICGWAVDAAPGSFMYQDTTYSHSGSASMVLGWVGETGGEFGGWGASAITTPAFCAPIGPGAHPASFWDGGAGSDLGPTWVYLGASFYPSGDCTGEGSYDSFGAPSDAPADWHQVTGALVAPPGTESALLSVSVVGNCANYSGCSVTATFDDLEVEDTILTTPAINSFTPLDGRVGTSVDIRGVNFGGSSSVTFNGTAASFTVDSDSEIHATVPSGATSGPIVVTTPNGTATSSSSFTLDVPRLDSFASSGPPGLNMLITGAYFTGATTVKFNGTPATFTVYSDWGLAVTVPSGATTGPISVTTPSGTGTSSSSFTVLPNTPPVAHFSFSCTTLTCSFDGSGSSDSDGTVATYAWDFGDGTTGTGRAPSHTYAQAAGYVVALTVTDTGGATGTTSKTVTLISLSAHGYRTRGLEKVDLAWTGPPGANFDVRRNGTLIATGQANAYTDTVGRNISGTFTYEICSTTHSVCSNTASVTF